MQSVWDMSLLRLSIQTERNQIRAENPNEPIMTSSSVARIAVGDPRVFVSYFPHTRAHCPMPDCKNSQNPKQAKPCQDFNDRIVPECPPEWWP